MNTEMTIDQLQTAMDVLRRLDFPGHPNDPDLAEWILDLAELDGHLVGLASTALASRASHSATRLDSASTHRARLHVIKVVGADKAIYDQCVAYAVALERVEAALAGRLT
jgi:hypothetical protein